MYLMDCKAFYKTIRCFSPVSIGRSVMLLWMGDASVHELYTAACGLYIIWLVCRVGSVLVSWVPLGWKGVAMKFLEWFLLVSYLYLIFIVFLTYLNSFGYLVYLLSS